MPAATQVLRVADVDQLAIARLLARYGLRIEHGARGAAIPGSYWGEPEAGLIGDRLYVRADTPLHSLLHEACHYLCMTPERRVALDTNAGGDYDEENCVCYLQLVVADQLPGIGRARLAADMDAWGYSFRLGSALAWFQRDAEDARAALHRWGLLDQHDRLTWRLRDAVSAGAPDVRSA